MTVLARTEILAVVQYDDARWLGRLVGSRSSGPPRVQFPEGRGPDDLPLGTRVAVGVATRAMGAPPRGTAVVAEVEHTSRGPIVGLIPDHGDFLGGVPEASAGGDRRGWPRFTPDPENAPVVKVRMESGPASGRTVSAKLVDASRGGIGLKFPLAVEARLCEARVLWCSVPLPGRDIPTERPCEVRSRVLLPHGVRYGLAFREAPSDPPPPRFEALWDCVCGEKELLGDSHTHCCSCGVERSAPTRLPDWEDLVPVERHRFTGAALTCFRCGSAWSGLARNCGHCGKRLPLRG
jgi:hypothetical protein